MIPSALILFSSALVFIEICLSPSIPLILTFNAVLLPALLEPAKSASTIFRSISLEISLRSAGMIWGRNTLNSCFMHAPIWDRVFWRAINYGSASRTLPELSSSVRALAISKASSLHTSGLSLTAVSINPIACMQWDLNSCYYLVSMGMVASICLRPGINFE